jgi:hypothetical protein
MFKLRRKKKVGSAVCQVWQKEEVSAVLRLKNCNKMHERVELKWKDNNKISLKGMRWEAADWTHLAQDCSQYWTVVNMVIKLRLP